MNQSFHLYQLQKIDSQIDWINQRLIIIQTIISQDTRLKEAQDAHDHKQNEVTQEQKSLKRIESEISARQIKLEQSEENLYSGRIKAPKELQDIQNEIAAIKRSITGLEDQQIEIMLKLESLQSELLIEEKKLLQTQATVTQDHALLLGEQTQITNDRERLSTERAASVQQINPESLEKYSHLRKTKKGIAVSVVADYSCSACGGTITPSDCQTARTIDPMFFCPTCGRIVYAG